MKHAGVFNRAFFTVLFFVVLIGMLGCNLMYFKQETMIFYPEALPTGFRYSFPGRFEELAWPVEGAVINALRFEAEQPKGVVLYFHGNAGSLRSWGEIAPDFTGRGYDVVIPDYRGFGKSTGRISSEKMLLQDAAAAYDRLRERYPESRIILYGRSIGTGLAVHFAAANRPRMVILESPYYSFLDLAAHHYPLVPRPLLRVLLRYPLRTDQWIAKVTCPVYLFHGEKDEIIPHDASVRLLPLIRSERRLITIPSGGHNDLGEHAQYREHLDRILK
jgi:pimeloyl-ACP methyl ester carboxylesterase